MKSFASLMLAVTGVMGLVFTVNSMIEGNETGAGLLLAASAVAFGVLRTAQREESGVPARDGAGALRDTIRAIRESLSKMEERLGASSGEDERTPESVER